MIPLLSERIPTLLPPSSSSSPRPVSQVLHRTQPQSASAEVQTLLPLNQRRCLNLIGTMAPPSPCAEGAYTSVMPQILPLPNAHRLTSHMMGRQVWATYEDICRHASGHEQKLNGEGKKWLTELLAWEMFGNPHFQLPLPRHPSPKHPLLHSLRLLHPNHPPLLRMLRQPLLLSWRLPCPFIRVAKCMNPAENHGDFKYRLGVESTEARFCPECWDEALEKKEMDEWVIVDRQKEKNDIMMGDWMMVLTKTMGMGPGAGRGAEKEERGESRPENRVQMIERRGRGKMIPDVVWELGSFG
ncbi:uncharacterized protein PAC_09739 [Phialocephala subalpina]|uniref:Uncharacterized protein n=1 Tax=Phialocephala subalpina TaxID=576137 RepID=A0A1L7X4A3_9HELO|nr:uncharacterized protein PAC_09739 [Phialocephala subalpina]